MSAKQAINDNLQGSVATCLRCSVVVINQIKKGLLLSLCEFLKWWIFYQSYKQERGFLMHFARPTNTLLTRSSAIAEGPRDASCQLKTCQLPRNSAETTYTTSPDQIDGMKLEI